MEKVTHPAGGAGSGANDDPDPKPGGPATVCVAGLVGNPGTGDGRATLWTNGVPTQLGDAASEARCVFVAQ
jgi:hypothetical protein